MLGMGQINRVMFGNQREAGESGGKWRELQVIKWTISCMPNPHEPLFTGGSERSGAQIGTARAHPLPESELSFPRRPCAQVPGVEKIKLGSFNVSILPLSFC